MLNLVLNGAGLAALVSYLIFLKVLMERAPLLDNVDVPASET